MFQFIKRNPAIILIIPLLVVSILYYDQLQRNQVENENIEVKEDEKPKYRTVAQSVEDFKRNNTLQLIRDLRKDEPITLQTAQIAHSGWVPNYDSVTALTDIKLSQYKMDILMPVWYILNENGEITDQRPANYKQFTNYAKTNNIKVVPTIQSFNADHIGLMLNDPELYNNHITQLANLVKLNGYDGMDIDYESTYLDDKELFLRFVKDLGTALDQHDAILSVTVISKWGDDILHTSLPQTRAVQDWEEINKHADQIRIMVYDFTTTSSTVPGPIAPLNWAEEVLKYALTKIEKEKIWLGVHLYGYEWSSDGASKAYNYNTIESILSDPEVEVQIDQENDEAVAIYPCYTDQSCTLYFQNPETLQDRIDLAKKYGIAGLAYWRLGRNGTLLSE